MKNRPHSRLNDRPNKNIFNKNFNTNNNNNNKKNTHRMNNFNNNNNYFNNIHINNNINNIININETKENYPKLDIIESENANEIYKYLKIDQEIFIIKFVKEDNKISIFCLPLDEFVCLYDYSIQISYEEFCKLSKIFSVYESIDDIFKIIKNIVEEVNISKNEEELTRSKIYIKYTTNESIILYLKLPTLIGTYEKIKIEFNKVEKDINKQFQKLKKNFLNLKTVILENNIESTRRKLINEINNPKKIIQNKSES